MAAMPKWILALSTAVGAVDECSVAAGGSHSSAMLQMRAGTVKLSAAGGRFAEVYDSALQLLKDGATPEVMSLANKTIEELEVSVMPAVHASHETDAKLLESALARFDAIAADYAKKSRELRLARSNRDEISASHVSCRGEEKALCDAARQCERERVALWEIFLEKNSTYAGDAAELCDMPSQSMDAREKHYEAMVASGAERFASWDEHETKRLECERRAAEQAAKAGECDLLKRDLEAAACSSHELFLGTWQELTADWALALDAHAAVRAAVEKEQADRHHEARSIAEVKCLLGKVYERSGKPCGEQDGGVDEAEKSCKEEADTLDLAALTFTFEDPPEKPSRAPEEPYPCQHGFIQKHYGSFMQDSCFSEMPACHLCGGLACPEPNVVYEGKCFYVHEEPQRFSYEEAKAYCADTGGQIASIHSKEENSAVLPLVDQRSSYVGATRECTSATDCGPWSWEDGSEWVEPDWPTDKLNSNGGRWKNGETHIVIHKDKKWHDWERGQVVKDVLCQFGTTTTTTPKLCPSPNEVVGSKCYYVHESAQAMSYELGKQYCSDTQGIVASIHRKAENDAALRLAHGRSSYIGATRECTSATDCGPWRWEDGSEWVEPTWPTDKLNSNGGRWKNGETHIVIHKDKKWHDWERGQVAKDVLCQQTGCFIAEDLDYTGADIPGGQIRNVASAAACQALCQQRPDCQAYTYGKKPGKSYTRTCFLKSSVPAGKKSDCCDSGLPCRDEPGEPGPSPPPSPPLPPTEACPPPRAELFKICSLWGDPHFATTFAHKDFTADNRHKHENRGKLVNHYELGLFWLFRSKDRHIEVQGFFCDARGKFNSLSMLVVKVGKQRLFWKRPDDSFPAWGDHLKKGNKFGMELTVDGKPVSAEDMGTGMSTEELWFQKLAASGWLRHGNEPMCLGTHDGSFTLKITSPGLSKVFEPVLVLELAKDQLDMDPSYLCSMEKGNVRVVEPVAFDDSLFTVDELHGMCDGCGMKAKTDARHRDFSGCNPPTRPTEAGAEFCKEQGASAEVMAKCDHLEGDWKDACLVEVCAEGAEGAENTEGVEESGPDAIQDALVAVGMKCPHQHEDRLFRQPPSGNTPAVASLEDCQALCEQSVGCKFFSYQQPGTFKSLSSAGDHDGVCMGCTSADNAEAHMGFNLYRL